MFSTAMRFISLNKKDVAIIASVTTLIVGYKTYTTQSKKIRRDAVKALQEEPHSVSLTFTDDTNPFVLIDQKYADHKACFGGSAVLKLLTEKDYNPSDLDIFIPEKLNLTREDKIKQIQEILPLETKAVSKEYTGRYDFDSRITGIIELTGPKVTKEAIEAGEKDTKARKDTASKTTQETPYVFTEKVQFVEINCHYYRTKIDNWYLNNSDLPICISWDETDKAYKLRFRSYLDMILMREGYLTGEALMSDERKEKYMKRGFIVDNEKLRKRRDEYITGLKNNIQIPFYLPFIYPFCDKTKTDWNFFFKTSPQSLTTTS